MGNCELIHKVHDTDTELVIHFQSAQDGEVVYERDVRGNDEADIGVLCEDLVKVTGKDLASVEQTVAEIVTAERSAWLGKKQRKVKAQEAAEDGQEDTECNRRNRYRADYGDAGHGSDGPGSEGILDVERERLLTNFVLLIEEDIEVQDDIETQRLFKGWLIHRGKRVPFQITAKDYSDNNKLRAAIYTAGGPDLVVTARMEELRMAISSISGVTKPIAKCEVTTNYGWTKDADAFLVPGRTITSRGRLQDEKGSQLHVDLAGEELAKNLRMIQLDGKELIEVKKHIVEDLLACQDRRVTYALLAATSLAVLYPFADGVGRLALWLTGITGGGKSFIAKLFANFFGNFPITGDGRFATWAATPNYIQRQGYFFKDALYLVDDFKPEVVQGYQVIRVLQNYADGTGRGRLKVDATTNVSRPIRGLLVSTGEDIPEHSASVVARSVVVPVPQTAKDLKRGASCIKECKNYSGVMADYIRWLMEGKRTGEFAERVQGWQDRYYKDVTEKQNGLRIAGNFAQLAASIELMAEYLADVWPGWEKEVKRFTEEDLLAIRNDMLGAVKCQQDSEVFMETLGELIRHGHVAIDGYPCCNPHGARVIGKERGAARGMPRLPNTQKKPSDAVFEISTTLAREVVNESLRKQGRRLLVLSDSALLNQLKTDGKLMGQGGAVLDADDQFEPTHRTRLDGRQIRCITVSKKALLGNDDGEGQG
jgi:hypothetical protein